MKEELKQIMSLSFPFCKNRDDVLAEYFRKINSLAHDAETYMNKHGADEEGHWGQDHHKNYHMS